MIAREVTWERTTFDDADLLRPTAVPPAESRDFLRLVPDSGPLSARIRLGEKAGVEAAAEARGRGALTGVKVEAEGGAATDAAGMSIRELLAGLRPYESRKASRTVPSKARALPVFGTFDVVVVGGGTSGAPAGIAAGRAGARTLIVEYLHTLGGVGSDGMVLGYY